MRSFRRHQIDIFLNSVAKYMSGKILDIGGKKDGKRGKFRPPQNANNTFTYLNNSIQTNPDILADAHNIPCASNSFNCILLCEVLEHVKSPDKVLSEAFRLLEVDGVLIGTIPFIFKVHADPDDFQRWTAQKLRLALAEAGFLKITIQPMGGVVGVIYDLIRGILVVPEGNNKIWIKILQKIFANFFNLFVFFDRFTNKSRNHTTSGWGFVAAK